MFIAVVQHTLGPFVALGNCLKYRKTVLNGTPIAVAAYKAASAFALLKVHKINNIIHQDALGTFEAAPSIIQIFYPDADKPPVSKRGHQSGVLTNPVHHSDQQSTTSHLTSSQSTTSSFTARKCQGRL